MPPEISSTPFPRETLRRSGADMRSAETVMDQARGNGPFSGNEDQFGMPGADGARGVVLFASVVLLLILVAVATGLIGKILPTYLASRIGYNSEGYLFALVLTPWVYYVSRHAGQREVGLASALIGFLWFVVGLGLLNSSLPSAIKTLHEPALALGIMLPYVALRRPLPRWVPPTLVLGALLVVGLGMFAARPAPGMPMGSSNWVIYLGEAVFLVLLTIVALDLVDRWMLDVTARRLNWGWRLAFYAILVATPITVSALGSSTRVGDQWFNMSLNYLGRTHESFVGVAILCGTLLLGYSITRNRACQVKSSKF